MDNPFARKQVRGLSLWERPTADAATSLEMMVNTRVRPSRSKTPASAGSRYSANAVDALGFVP